MLCNKIITITINNKIIIIYNKIIIQIKSLQGVADLIYWCHVRG